MGVPGFVAWLRECFKDIMILNNLDKNPDFLYIDGNCLIHPKCFEVLANCSNDIDNDKLEKLMFKRITKFITFLIDYSQPKTCYFAVDGVGPAAKINQQRFRRYKSVIDNDFKKQLKKKYNMDQSIEWSNTVITPGTAFMNRLDKYLTNYFNEQSQKYPHIKYIYSSYLEPGEGEHKLLNHLRNLPVDLLETNTYVIYGLDADLFFLSMACKKKNIFLLREEQQFVNGKPEKSKLFDIIDDIAEEMRYVSIDITKKCYDIKMAEIIKNRLNDDSNKLNQRTDYCNDFVFICYLLGNDFIPHLPTIDIKKNGLDIIIDCYVETYITLGINLLNRDINDKISINMIFLTELLRLLSNLEEQYYNEIIPKHEYKMSRRKCFASDAYSKEMWDYENLRSACFKDKNNDPIKLGYGEKSLWKFRYYEYYFGVSEHYLEFVDIMSQMYMEGLGWVTQYYYIDCPSWKWKYPFIQAPFISDIYDFIKRSNFDINNIIFKKSEPLKPAIQLLAVLPYALNEIIPIEYRHLVTDKDSPIYDLYPVNVKLDYLHKDMNWSCNPILPYLDIERIIKATINCDKL